MKIHRVPTFGARYAAAVGRRRWCSPRSDRAPRLSSKDLDKRKRLEIITTRPHYLIQRYWKARANDVHSRHAGTRVRFSLRTRAVYGFEIPSQRFPISPLGEFALCGVYVVHPTWRLAPQTPCGSSSPPSIRTTTRFAQRDRIHAPLRASCHNKANHPLAGWLIGS
jgi:hypothetical protein